MPRSPQPERKTRGATTSCPYFPTTPSWAELHSRLACDGPRASRPALLQILGQPLPSEIPPPSRVYARSPIFPELGILERGRWACLVSRITTDVFCPNRGRRR